MKSCATLNRRLRSNLPYLGKSSLRAAILQKRSTNGDGREKENCHLFCYEQMPTFGSGLKPESRLLVFFISVLCLFAAKLRDCSFSHGRDRIS